MGKTISQIGQISLQDQGGKKALAPRAEVSQASKAKGLVPAIANKGGFEQQALFVTLANNENHEDRLTRRISRLYAVTYATAATIARLAFEVGR